MELVIKEGIITVKALEVGGKQWARCIHDGKGTSDFVTKTRSRSKQGAMIDQYDIGKEPKVLQISDGRDKAFYKTSGDTITEIKSYQLSQCFAPVKTLKVTLEFDLADKDLVTEILQSINKLK